MSFDLLQVPTGYETDLALIVAPYFDETFTHRLIKQLSPRRLYFVVDDGSDPGDLEALRDLCPDSTSMKIALGSASGLVHIKGYYFEYVKTDGQRQRRKRRFVFGSANATNAGFSGRRNAELIASVDLSRNDDGNLLEYVHAIIDAVESGGGHIRPGIYGPLRNAPTLNLPRFKISPIGPAPAFDGWLQRGRLIAKYREAQQFLSVMIRLKERLPADVVTTTFSERRLIEPGERNAVRYPYIGDTDLEDLNDDAAHQWNASLGVWTHLGNWVSADCHRVHRTIMKSQASRVRRAKLEEFLANGGDPRWLAARKDDLLAALDGVWTDLRNNGAADPSNYLTGDTEGINRTHYADRLDKKVASDLLLARDNDFCDRYVTGYEFPNVPRFRHDEEAWNSFALSFCTSIAVEASKSRTVSLLTQAVRSAMEWFGESLAEKSADEILDWLRHHWSKEVPDDAGFTVEDYLVEYWEVRSW